MARTPGSKNYKSEKERSIGRRKADEVYEAERSKRRKAARLSKMISSGESLEMKVSQGIEYIYLPCSKCSKLISFQVFGHPADHPKAPSIPR